MTVTLATSQVSGNNLSPNNPGSDPTSAGYPTSPDPTIKPMLNGSYDAKLFKQLSPDMKAKMQALFP